MGCKTPEDILFGSHRPQIQPVAVDIFKFAYLPLFNQFLYLPDSGMEKEKVADHQVYVVFFGKFLETPCFRCLECQGFFDENVSFVAYKGGLVVPPIGTYAGTNEKKDSTENS